MDAMLSVSEVAKLAGVSERYIRQIASKGKIPYEVTTTSKGRPKYVFPLAGLAEWDATLPKKYLREQAKATGTSAVLPAPAESQPLDHFTAEERAEISFWTQTVSEWRAFRAPHKDKQAADEAYLANFRLDHPDITISRDILYSRQRAVKEGNLKGLTDGRGKARRGRSSIPDVAWQAFLYYYLDEGQHPIRECYKYTNIWAQENEPDLLPLPDYTTFYRHLKTDLPMPVAVLAREGEKAFTDRCGPYIRREYDTMRSNEWWIADNHTFDVITEGDDGKRHRLYLTAFFDARSGIFTGCHVTDAPSSQSTLIALRRGIMKYGIPENIYVDNGREFLTRDVGGLGHRQKKSSVQEFAPPPVFERLGIKMTNAIVRNARAKIIERRFLDVKNEVSRLFETYTGGTVVEKPERLKHVLKNGNVVLDGNFTAAIADLIDGWMNESEYGGAVIADRGKTRMEVWTENLTRKRIAPPEDLNLMLMRSSRPVKVGRTGVSLKICGARMDYYTPEFTLHWQGKQVYYRYDPDDLRTVRVYDLEDRFICELPNRSDMVMRYGADRESIAAAMANIRGYKRMVKAEAAAQTKELIEVYGEQSAFDLVLATARKNLSARLVGPEDAKPGIIELHRAQESPLLMAASGEDMIDFDRLTANASKQHGGVKDDEDL